MKNLATKSSQQLLTPVMALWWALWFGGQTYLLNTLGWGWAIALTDALITQTTLALGGLVMNNTFRYYQPGERNVAIIVIWSLLMAALVCALQLLLLRQLAAETYQPMVTQLWLLRYLFDWLMMAFMSALSWMWHYLRNQQQQEKRRQEAADLARDAELANLRQQLQPHFLFNSLNSISALIGSRPEEARTMVQQLSDFLRGTLKKEDRHFVAFQDELTHLQLYLDIEKVRFGHRLLTTLTYADEVLALKVPALLLQPIVENAIKFGLYDTTGALEITIAAHAENGQLVVNVTNPFDPETAPRRQGTGFGLAGVQRRLYLLFFRNDLLHTQQQQSTFITTIRIPQTA